MYSLTILETAIYGIMLVGLVTGKSCPKIITREEWGARSANQTKLETYPPTHVIIHHSATASCSTQSKCSALVRAFQNYHMDTQGWEDIGYNFLVGGDGQVYEGRGWGNKGAHAKIYNSKSIGICFIGTFTSILPPDEAIAVAHELIDCGVSNDQIATNYTLVGHRQASATECPGNKLYDTIKSWPHWKLSP